MRRLISCYFDAERNGFYPRMVRILEHTARAACPGWDISVEALPHTRNDTGTSAANTKKLEWWSERVAQSQDGDEVALVDCDCVVTGALDAVWYAQPFDVALTRRDPNVAYPYNAGVVFVRVSDRSRLFMQTWAAVNAKMRVDRIDHAKWRAKYGGMNQAALGAVLEAGISSALGVAIADLPCSTWNCEDSTWLQYDPEITRIVHYKSRLRIAALGIGDGMPQCQGLVSMWRRLDREVNG